MFDTLRKHALASLWCNPEQDRQFYLSPARVTKPSGSYGFVSLMGNRIALPKPQNKFHVFQVGQLTPSMLGLLNDNPSWLKSEWHHLPDAMRQQLLIANVYTDSGIEVPRFRCWYLFTRSRALILAVEEDANIPINFGKEQLYFRFYTNAYFFSAGNTNPDVIVSEGKVAVRVEDILSYQNKVATYRNQNGYVFCYVNGMTVNEISPFTAKVGDSIEYVYDNSVKRVVRFRVGDLPQFSSKLDGNGKYLLHYPQTGEPVIDYHDDIDIHIVKPQSITKTTGLYYHRNRQDAVRMVTHHDYAIPAEMVRNFAMAYNELYKVSDPNVADFIVELKIRNNGRKRGLVFDSHRIFELYKLPDAEILPALTDGQASMSFWRAENLEASAYCEVMRSFDSKISAEMIESAFGYNGIAKLVGDTPMRSRTTGHPVMDVPIGLYENSTAYEFDANGWLIGSYPHAIGTEYLCVNASTKLVEMVAGKGSSQPTVRFGEQTIDLLPGYGYRVYMTQKDPTTRYVGTKWIDITDSGFYTVANNRLTWQLGETNQFMMVRFDDSFLDYELNFTPVAGTIYFTLSEFANYGDGVKHRTLSVPPGELDLWLNGKALVRDVDYIVRFPMVYIWNQSYIKQPALTTAQKIHVRARGFASRNLTMDPIEDRGWVEHGVLSRNNRYQLRDDRVLRIIVGGSTYHRDDLRFAETDSAIRVTDSKNGLPYEIKDLVVPLRNITPSETYALRDKAKEIDLAVEGFLQYRLKEPVRNAASSIPQRYPLYSLFMSHLVTDMLEQRFATDVNRMLTDNDVLDACKPYESLLYVDPLGSDEGVDMDYVIVRPHISSTVLEVKAFQFAFLQRVNKLYFNGQIPLSNFLSILS